MAGAQNVTWIQSGERTAFLEFYNKWNNQPHFDPAVIPILENQPLYINQFIRLIELIETTNTLSGKVDVLIALAIYLKGRLHKFDFQIPDSLFHTTKD